MKCFDRSREYDGSDKAPENEQEFFEIAGKALLFKRLAALKKLFIRTCCLVYAMNPEKI